MHELDMNMILGWVWRIAPVAVGAVGGYLFYRFVGCKTGTCPITKNPWISTIYGAIIGAMYVGH